MNDTNFDELKNSMMDLQFKQGTITMLTVIGNLAKDDHEKMDNSTVLDIIDYLTTIAYHTPDYIKITNKVIDLMNVPIHERADMIDNNLYVPISKIVEYVKRNNVDIQKILRGYVSKSIIKAEMMKHAFDVSDDDKSKLMIMYKKIDFDNLKSKKDIVRAILILIGCSCSFKDNFKFVKQLRKLRLEHHEFFKWTIEKIMGGNSIDDDKFNAIYMSITTGRFKTNMDAFIKLIENDVLFDPKAKIESISDEGKAYNCDGDCEHCELKDIHGHGDKSQKLYDMNNDDDKKETKKTMDVVEGESVFDEIKEFAKNRKREAENNAFYEFVNSDNAANKELVINFIKKRIKFKSTNKEIVDSMLDDINKVKDIDQYDLRYVNFYSRKFKGILEAMIKAKNLSEDEGNMIRAKGYIIADSKNI